MSVHKIYSCPTDRGLQCSWEGTAEDILDHFIMEHEDLLLHSSEVDIDLDITSENRLLFLNEEIYLIQIKIDKQLQIGLRYLGPDKIARAMSYDIVLTVQGQKYFFNYFENGPSIFKIIDGFWVVDLHVLELLHENLSTVQCNFDISNKNCIQDEISKTCEEDCVNEDLNLNYDETNDSSDQDTVIEDEEIDDILRENIDFISGKSDGDALDNISALNFSLLERNDRHCRRYSSFMGIPQELFDERETTDLTCSNCFINMLPPIYLCINNHNICADCRYESCKICYGNATENRNKELEDYSRICLHLCRYHSEGCLESFMYTDIRNHEMKCNFCVYRCVQDCSFRGQFLSFHSHFKIKHPSCKIHYSTPVDFPRNYEFIVYDLRLGIFHCSSSFLKNTVRWVVVFLGPRDRSFSCELSFKGSKSKDVSFLRRLEDQYSIAYTKENMKKLKVKDKNAVLNITSYFQ